MFAKTIIFMSLIIPTFGALPYEAVELKTKRDAKIAEINRSYISALSRLMDRFAADGEKEKAAEVKKLLEAAAAISEPVAAAQTDEDPRLKPLVGVWKRDYDNGIWTITDTKGGVFNGNLKFTMKFDAEKNDIVVIGTHWADRLSFTGNPNVVNGSTEQNGKTFRYKLRRID
jgi:hypothetical protein